MTAPSGQPDGFIGKSKQGAMKLCSDIRFNFKPHNDVQQTSQEISVDSAQEPSFEQSQQEANPEVPLLKEVPEGYGEFTFK